MCMKNNSSKNSNKVPHRYVHINNCISPKFHQGYNDDFLLQSTMYTFIHELSQIIGEPFIATSGEKVNMF